MSENNGILELIEMLYTMISEAWGVPLGNDKCLVDRDKALDLIEEIKAQLPAEMAEAKRLVSARDEFISNAKREAESVRKMAEERSRKMMEDQEVIRLAKTKADEMIANAESKSFELRRVANEYVDEALHGAEESVAAALDVVRQSRSRFRSAAANFSGQQPQQPQQPQVPQQTQQPKASQPQSSQQLPGQQVE
jgi:hypothetical protein